VCTVACGPVSRKERQSRGVPDGRITRRRMVHTARHTLRMRGQNDAHDITEVVAEAVGASGVRNGIVARWRDSSRSWFDRASRRRGTGPGLRASVELIEAPAGKTAWSQVAQVSLGDVFELQDSLARRIVSSLPLTAADRLRVGARDVPRDQHAYEAFLRANHYALESSTWRLAREQYQRGLALDPSCAPAWAGLGRIHRVLGKYSFAETWAEALAESEAALSRALALNPDLSGAHFYYAQLEADMGKAEDGMVRLLRRARGGRAEPEILAGLLHTCRYCGLLGAAWRPTTWQAKPLPVR
jgi:hypothetical protein